MSEPIRTKNGLVRHIMLFVACLTVIGVVTACNKSRNEGAEKAAQKTFASPEEAGSALVEVAKAEDRNALLAIFGPNFADVLFSEDPVKDKDSLQDFVSAYTQMHRWREVKAGGQMLYAGADNFVFPIPLGQNPSGQWYFDTAAGKDEILARRIGKDELAAIAACTAIADAQKQYFVKLKQYAQEFVSDEGKQNGLYWLASPGQPPSPLEDVRDFAKAAGYRHAGSKPQPFVGYYFRILTKQGEQAKGGARDYIVDGKMTGGFAILAYPAEYRNSGIMTFLVGRDGIVLQKDLGEKTSEQAAAMVEYNPAEEWKPAI